MLDIIPARRQQPHYNLTLEAVMRESPTLNLTEPFFIHILPSPKP